MIEEKNMTTGKVTWFNDSKGFGFLETEDKKNIFVHYTAILTDGFKTLNENDEVLFDLYETEKGFTAKNVRKVK